MGWGHKDEGLDMVGREWGERWGVGHLRMRIIQERSRKGAEKKMKGEQSNSGRGCEGRGKLYIYVLEKEGMFLYLGEVTG